MVEQVRTEAELTSPGGLLQVIREGRATTRADLAALTRVARSTVSARVESLIAGGWVSEMGEARSTGGRPPMTLAFNARAGVMLVADLGVTHCRLAVTDLAGVSLAEHAADLSIADGPDVVLDWVQERFRGLLSSAGLGGEDVRGIGIGLPGPVEFAAGRVVNPPIMPGWDGVSVPERLQERFPVPVLVDNDVNIMALGEYWTAWRETVDDFLFVKVGSGIGCGIIAGGQIQRGGQGAAGDIGHIRLSHHDDTSCHCGNQGCVEAVASGGALARRLTEMGFAAQSSRDVVQLVRAGNRAAVRMVRDAGRMLGEVLAGLVNFANPSVIVVGGDLARVDNQLLAGVREVVYQRSTTLATQHLQIERGALGDRAGVTGAAVMAIEHILRPETIDLDLARRLDMPA